MGMLKGFLKLIPSVYAALYTASSDDVLCLSEKNWKSRSDGIQGIQDSEEWCSLSEEHLNGALDVLDYAAEGTYTEKNVWVIWPETRQG